MQRRLLILRNVLKAWLVVTVTALLFGFVGWQLGGYQLALLFLGSIVLLAAGVYWYADRIVLGMVGAREMLPGEAPALHSTLERLAAQGGRGEAEAVRAVRQLPDGRSPADAGPAVAPGSPCRSDSSGSPPRPSWRGSSRTSWRTSETATCSSRRSP